MKTIALVGNPNVGKSVLFHKLTGQYVDVSNYPGTTVKVSKGKAKIGNDPYQVIDTPGTYTLSGGSKDERITRRILLRDAPDVVIVVLDAKNLERMLPFTLLLLETGYNIIVALNVMDEARKKGLEFDISQLEAMLNVPVVPTVATKNKGIQKLKRQISETSQHPSSPNPRNTYGHSINRLHEQLVKLISGSYNVSKRFLSLLLLMGDKETKHLLREQETNYEEIMNTVEAYTDQLSRPLFYLIQRHLHEKASTITTQVVSHTRKNVSSLRETLSHIMMDPITGIPILLSILFIMYEFVGNFGAQHLVDYIEVVIFGAYINPFLNTVLKNILAPYKLHGFPAGYWLFQLIGGQYGLVTLGFRYAIAIILPIVSTFFFFFSILEDSGYLSRLAMLMDRIFKQMGLNGRAVIPLVLGAGCDTMATMVTRTLDTKREKVIAILLLSLGVPCSAQLGVIFAIAPGFQGLAIWMFLIVLILFSTGYLSSKLLPGSNPPFIEEIPPLRMPQIDNVLQKTWVRLKWYFFEIFPLFLLISVLIWMGRLTGVFPYLVDLMAYPVHWIGLPPETGEVFLFGFFRRDYGAAGLYDLKMAGLLSDHDLLVSMVTITLFVPCIAQLLMVVREQGIKTAILIEILVFCIAFGTGFSMNVILSFFGV